jgi:hypothetical protein
MWYHSRRIQEERERKENPARRKRKEGESFNKKEKGRRILRVQ